MKCPHISECKQKISEINFKGLCLQEIKDWDQNDCFKYKDALSAVNEGELRTPLGWNRCTWTCSLQTKKEEKQ